MSLEIKGVTEDIEIKARMFGGKLTIPIDFQCDSEVIKAWIISHQPSTIEYLHNSLKEGNKKITIIID